MNAKHALEATGTRARAAGNSEIDRDNGTQIRAIRTRKSGRGNVRRRGQRHPLAQPAFF